MAMSRRHAARLQPPSLRLMLLMAVAAAALHTTVLCDVSSAGGSSSGVPKSPPDSAAAPSPSAPSAPSAAAGNPASTGGKEEPKSKASVRVPYKVHWAHMKTSDGRFIDARDMGVKHCALTVDGAAHGTSLGYSRPFTLHVFLRYTVHAGVANVKGSVAVQLMTPLEDSELRDADVHFRPFVTMATSDNATRHAIAGSAAFPFLPITTAAVASPLEGSFQLHERASGVRGSNHAYYITAKGADGECYFDAEREPNVMDVNAHEVEINKDLALPPRNAHVVMAPFYDLENERYQATANVERFSVLLDRHIQWHRTLGFQRYFVYIRQTDVMDFSAQRPIEYWTRRGVLTLVLWNEVTGAPLDTLSHFDQRIVYTHATLALTGHDAYLAMLDVDEYVVLPRPELRTVLDAALQCGLEGSTDGSGGSDGGGGGRSDAPPVVPLPPRSHLPPGAALPVSAGNLQLPRFHALMGDFHRLVPEAEMWVARQNTPRHPLTRYTLVNRKRPVAPKSLIRPEFVHTCGIYSCTGMPGVNGTSANPGCIMVIHLKQLLHARDAFAAQRSSLRRAGYSAEPSLVAMLQASAAAIDVNEAMHILPDEHVYSTVVY